MVQKENGINFALENHINIWSPCFLFCPQHQIVQPDHWITSVQPSSLSSFQKRQNSSLIPSLIVGSMGWGGPNNVNPICLQGPLSEQTLHRKASQQGILLIWALKRAEEGGARGRSS